MSRLTSILDVMKTDIGNIVNPILVSVRKNPFRIANDSIPHVIISGVETNNDQLHETKELTSFQIDIVYYHTTPYVNNNATEEDHIQEIRQMYRGFADLVVSGVDIDDVTYLGNQSPNRGLMRKGIDHTILSYQVDILENP